MPNPAIIAILKLLKPYGTSHFHNPFKFFHKDMIFIIPRGIASTIEILQKKLPGRILINEIKGEKKAILV